MREQMIASTVGDEMLAETPRQKSQGVYAKKRHVLSVLKAVVPPPFRPGSGIRYQFRGQQQVWADGQQFFEIRSGIHEVFERLERRHQCRCLPPVLEPARDEVFAIRVAPPSVNPRVSQHPHEDSVSTRTVDDRPAALSETRQCRKHNPDIGTVAYHNPRVADVDRGCISLFEPSGLLGLDISALSAVEIAYAPPQHLGFEDRQPGGCATDSALGIHQRTVICVSSCATGQ